ncbi:hypothetical protein ASY01nite_00340 [Acetobacter syzygii]|nr:hypothetical protein AA0483_1062 [Acetobacter syzygii NRIC 0483]GEL54968.1 hypothetical protein ASY01nite_00340 [Acetobacter syzygii]
MIDFFSILKIVNFKLEEPALKTMTTFDMNDFPHSAQLKKQQPVAPYIWHIKPQ